MDCREFGKHSSVVYVSIEYYKSTEEWMGFVFVEFETRECSNSSDWVSSNLKKKKKRKSKCYK